MVDGADWAVVYLHGRYLQQLNYLQDGQVFYICQQEQFHQLAFQGI